jgi:drug/metabolite transporter (DMT)-like permease
MKHTLLSWILLFSCNLMWSLQFTCIKLVQDQVGPYFTVWGPMLLSLLLLVPSILRHSKKRISWKDFRVFGSLALLGAFPAQVLMTWGTQYSLASNAAILTLSLPVITAFFAFLMLREKMNVARWISFIIAIAGVVLCSFGDFQKLDFSSRFAWGNLLIFLAIVGNAYYNTGCKGISKDYSEVEMVFFTYIAMIILLTPLVFFFEYDTFSRIHLFTTQTWTGLALLTFFHNFLSMILFFRALKMLDAIQVALSNYLITFFGLPIAAIWLNESLSGWTIAGGVLVLTGTLIITIWDYKSNRQSASVKIAKT